MEQREALVAVLSDRTVTSKNHAAQLMLNENEWGIVETIVNILEPFQIVTTLLSSENQPTVSMVMPILQSLMQNFISTEDIKKEKKKIILLK
ncbi:ribonuclease h-like superfamily [Holotrichia oblita]|uniref:Ribonuclease h-like superfamily n=1 Tax=Holotrichia oblita TaxID=644536 RepID=A0ACB9SLU0_HOLOL|nr:ribonuclease h-like superfamily [Holotrichia oblita]